MTPAPRLSVKAGSTFKAVGFRHRVINEVQPRTQPFLMHRRDKV